MKVIFSVCHTLGRKFNSPLCALWTSGSQAPKVPYDIPHEGSENDSASYLLSSTGSAILMSMDHM